MVIRLNKFGCCGVLVIIMIGLMACGTLNIQLEDPQATAESTTPPHQPADNSTPDSPEAPQEVVAWYGSIHSVPGADAGADFFKPWHLNIWPKFSLAVGIAGSDLATNAEIDRLRDTDTKATLWGHLFCGVGDYGGCQLLVTQISAADGGPHYAPQRVEAWEGTIGQLPAQPGSQNDSLYFVLSGRVPALYGLTTQDAAIQAMLEHLTESGQKVRIWGELDSKSRPVTGTNIDIDRLEVKDD